ncbi:hypothetical protein CUMW_008570 [Citrus unshiu]|nr:hypothetical protein CUMW_008570 [Citrus unshiu]
MVVMCVKVGLLPSTSFSTLDYAQSHSPSTVDSILVNKKLDQNATGDCVHKWQYGEFMMVAIFSSLFSVGLIGSVNERAIASLSLV